MKNLLKLSFYLSLVFMIGLASCGDDDDDDDINCDDVAQALEDEQEVLTEAISGLISDPEGGCQAFVDALDDYIDLIEDGRSCLSAAEQEELDEALAEFEASRDLFECPG